MFAIYSGPGKQRVPCRIQLDLLNKAADGASAAFEFLIPGESELPPGSRIVWRNVTYDVATVRQCRDLDGFPRAIRCTVC